MNRKEMKQLLEERFERITLLETRIDTMEQLVDGYHAREQSLIDTLHTAQNTAKKLVEEARAEAEAIRGKARREGEAMLAETKQTAQSTMQQAQQQAREIQATAKSESDRLLRDAEIIKREYEELVSSFNAMLEQNASELRETATRFAEFVRGRKIEASEVRLDGEAFYKSVGAMNDAKLPDPEGDPAALMKNIYLLQKRPIPAAEDTTPEGIAAQGEAGAEPAEEQPQLTPFSEQAWASARQQSQSEPQAEFTPAFDSAFEPSNVEVKTNECAVPAGEAEHAFDAYFSNQAFFGSQGAGKPEPEPEPFTEAAWESAHQEGGQEPQEEAARAFDAFFSDSIEPDGKTARDETAPKQAGGPEDAAPEPYSEKAWAQDAYWSAHEPQAEGALAFDALFGEPTAGSAPVSEEDIPAGASEQSATPKASDYASANESAAPEPEPYSERAWAQSAFMSDHEPQAEGTLAFDTPYDENAAGGAFEQSFEAEHEPREWEPEREPEAEEVPTVSQFVSPRDEEEVSLDALLEEIIKAGE